MQYGMVSYETQCINEECCLGKIFFLGFPVIVFVRAFF